MDSCLQIQDTKSARVELAYPDCKSSALTSKLLLKLLYVSNCQNKMCVLSNLTRPRLFNLNYGHHVKHAVHIFNKAPFSFALPTELIPRKLGDIGVEPMTQKVSRTLAVRAF